MENHSALPSCRPCADRCLPPAVCCMLLAARCMPPLPRSCRMLQAPLCGTWHDGCGPWQGNLAAAAAPPAVPRSMSCHMPHCCAHAPFKHVCPQCLACLRRITTSEQCMGSMAALQQGQAQVQAASRSSLRQLLGLPESVPPPAAPAALHRCFWSLYRLQVARPAGGLPPADHLQGPQRRGVRLQRGA